MTFIHCPSVPWGRLVRGSLIVLAFSGIEVGCDAPSPSPNLASNTNWLVACDADAQCDTDLSCNCGACSRSCSSDDDCRGYAGTHCVSSAEHAAIALCGHTDRWATQGACLPRCNPGECGTDQFCTLGVCVPVQPPETEFCATNRDIDGATLRAEEALAEAVEQLRSAGGNVCENGSTTAQLPLLRIDARLMCAARALARDMASTGNHLLTDSAGRNTEARLALAVYPQTRWAEGFAWDVASADAALKRMLEDAGFCTGFKDAALMDLGVGYSSDVFVVTIAAR